MGTAQARQIFGWSREEAKISFGCKGSMFLSETQKRKGKSPYKLLGAIAPISRNFPRSI